MKENKLAKINMILFILILIIGGICIFFLPYLYDIFKNPDVPKFKEQTLLYKIAFYACYILCLIIIYKLIRLFNSVQKGSPFNKEVENSLKVSATLFIIISLIVFIKGLFIPTILTFAVVLVCLIAGLSFYVLKEVITSAINYKNEVDYTV